jgi:hypothetical protein
MARIFISGHARGSPAQAMQWMADELVAMEGPRGTDNRPEVTDNTPFIWGL